MKSSEAILNVFYKLLFSFGFQNFITGSIYKYTTEYDGLENIEIQVLSNRNEYVQTGYLNLNVLVPSLDDNTPSSMRFEEVSNEINTKLKENNFLNVRFQIEQQSGIIQDMVDDKYHFVNFKFNFQTM